MTALAPRDPKDLPSPGNPVVVVNHVTRFGSDECLGLHARLWCPGCQELHAPRFRCLEHGGPAEGPVWEGNPHAEPFGFEPSLLVNGGAPEHRCHSFVRAGQWEFLSDCWHPLAGLTVPLEPLPDWLVDR